MIHNRWVIIIELEYILGYLGYNASEITDSQALHSALCQVCPGNVYTAKFTSKVPRSQLKGRELAY
jgi:hypothetical protein